MNHPRKIRVIEPFLAVAIFSFAVFYLINALNTGNWLWFQSRAVHVRPSRIIIVDHGQRTLIGQGHPQYLPLADAAETSLSRLGNTDLVSIGLSDQTLSDYETDSVVVELYFDRPVIFNSMARTGEPTQLLIPIEGRHAGGGYVFRGTQGTWWFGAIRMADPAPLMTVLQEMGYETAVAAQPAS